MTLFRDQRTAITSSDVTIFRWTEIHEVSSVTDVPRRSPVPGFMRALGLALRAERERQGRTQEEVCASSGLDRTYLSGIERGDRSPNLRTLLRVTGALAVPLSRVVLAAEAAENGRGATSLD